MKLYLRSLISIRTTPAIFFGIAITAGVFVFRAQADQWDKTTILTVNQPIQVTDKVLDPGQYVFKLVDSDSNRHIVRIYNSDRSQVIDTVLAIPNYRLEPTGHSRFSFWETPPGNARALRAWFYPGDNVGQEFRYPKQLARLETTTPVAAPVPQPPAAEPPKQEPMAPVPEQPQSMNQTSSEEKQPVEIAQSTPPASPESAPEPAGPSAQDEKVLPKTGTQYPLIGLTGAVLLGLCGLLRLKRSA